MNYEEWIKEYNRKDTFAVQQGIKLVNLSSGYAKAQIDCNTLHKNLHGCIHGGLLFTLCDIAAGCSLSTDGRNWVTQSSNIQYLRSGECGILTASAKVIKSGRRVGVCSVDVTNSSGELLCIGTFTMMNLDINKKTS